jgi:hypothetical protein
MTTVGRHVGEWLSSLAPGLEANLSAGMSDTDARLQRRGC